MKNPTDDKAKGWPLVLVWGAVGIGLLWLWLTVVSFFR